MMEVGIAALKAVITDDPEDDGGDQVTVREAYNYSVYFLGANGVDEEEFKAKCLVCHLAKIANRDYHSHLGDLVSQKKLADGLWQLKSGTPLQYVLGEWDFLDSTVPMGPGVLIPRPETEELAQLAIEQVKNAGSTPVVWDLCAGSGCIGISALPMPVRCQCLLCGKVNRRLCLSAKERHACCQCAPCTGRYQR